MGMILGPTLPLTIEMTPHDLGYAGGQCSFKTTAMPLLRTTDRSSYGIALGRT